MWHTELALVLGTRIFLVHLGKQDPALLEKPMRFTLKSHSFTETCFSLAVCRPLGALLL